MIFRRTIVLLAAICVAGCAHYSRPRENPAVTRSVQQACGKGVSPEMQVARYLQVASRAASALRSGTAPTVERDTYNAAAAELAVLLRSADGGRLWNRPLNVSAGGETWRLRFQAGDRHGVWAPDYFTSLVLARDVADHAIKRRDRREGVGGALVGVHKKTPREDFAPLVGVTAPVTATLDFQGRNATLTLRDPSEQSKARVTGAMRPLDADFSAPLAYYPSPNETIAGLLGAMRGADFMNLTGIYQLQPYDPDRIPVILVHGLISTARMWRNVINEIEMDPTLRGRFQFWVFNYPTGNPVAYSALRFREDLAKAEQRYGFPKGFILIGHSMGGVVSRMQATTLDRGVWEREIGAKAEALFAEAPADSVIHRALIFDANPKIRRIVFICTPHRGSQMALGSIGAIGMRLITLPASLTSAITKSVGNTLSVFSGGQRLPNSITSLSPKNPTLKAVASVTPRPPHHTILGDRGRGNSPNSSDGIVPYWSSHLDSAQSEKIVPGPHGSCELPQTIEELKRILHLHLTSVGR